ncbi:MAG: cadherin-like beta sandwich domain-containing protein [Candidatus Symbiothrix sp.]|jgi:hypothetical protein|nr:cadherin-like beta sandwich domain-containing protein [Candidatus Symbiothrix sp.]
MKNIFKYGFFSVLTLVGILSCEDRAEEIDNVNYPRPFSPTNIKAEITNQTDVSIKWDEVDNAISYVTELYSNDSLAFAPDALTQTREVIPVDIPVHFLDLEKNIRYSIRVKAIKADGTESKWEGITFKTEEIKVKITEWNFSEGELNEAAQTLGSNTTFEDVKVINGLTIHAASGKSMRFTQYAAAEVDGYDFSWYLDLQGGGTAYDVEPRNRCVSFEVTEPCIITIYANAAVGRTLEAFTTTGVIGTLAVNDKAQPATKMLINWTGGKERIYVRSQSSGLNLYLIRVAVGEVYIPNTVSDLTRLTVSEGTLTPAFSGSTYDYTINVPYSTQSVTFTPTLGHAKQTINGSLTANLTAAETNHSIEVVAEDGTTSSTYTFKIIRETERSIDATLKTLVITGGGDWNPAFSPDVTSYVYTIPNELTSVTITATANHSYATVGGSGNTYSDLQVGNNGPYTISVIAENNSIVKTYSVTVKRELPAVGNNDKDWNFSEAPFGEVIEYSTEITLDDLTLIPASDKTIKFTANNKSMDGFSFTHRLQLQGSGSTTANALKFAVTGACKITVYGMAANSSATDRPLIISDGTTELFSEVLLGDVIYKKEYDYTGGAGDLYIYSGNSGLNLYMIRVAYP